MRFNLTSLLCVFSFMAAGELFAQVTTLPEPIVPFVEDFESGTANFGGTNDNFLSDLRDGDVFISAGGVDGSNQLTTVYSLDAASTVVFRGEAVLESSDLAFTGNYITGGVEEVSLFVQHDAPIPLQFGIRIATQTPFVSDNFPGAFITGLDPVAPDTLTQLAAEISPDNVFDPGNFQFGQITFFEGGNFASIFSDVTNLQVTAELPDGFTAVSEDLANIVANNLAIDLPAGAVVGDVFDSFSIVEDVLLVDANGDAILDDMDNEQFVDLEVPTAGSSPIFNTADEFTVGLDNVSIVPEPTAGLLFALGLIGPGVTSRRRK